jgi:hypothetical protein
VIYIFFQCIIIICEKSKLRYGKAADVYSLGIALYILIGGGRYGCGIDIFVLVEITVSKSNIYTFALDIHSQIRRENSTCRR